ncbi:hypothetical protein BX661DRAFT_223387 [Kickxella alabastrina]|uniref:uncharacterized protein n=1 Tax=Kickxella alabastrina TaxID=61397 RepID=UPI00222065D3|nr:uncharacterized protein BX661DRAFT_223387 [Kickxella alabastrina]KAI7831907.1 hypothetical protein BX661DRAFT_223387 [Kickxella alabastrina]
MGDAAYTSAPAPMDTTMNKGKNPATPSKASWGHSRKASGTTANQAIQLKAMVNPPTTQPIANPVVMIVDEKDINMEINDTASAEEGRETEETRINKRTIADIVGSIVDLRRSTWTAIGS